MIAPADIGSGPLNGLPVRRLTETDLPAIVELAADRRWPPEESKWRLIFAVSETYGVDDPAGGLAGIVALTKYGTELAAIGMMLVASRHGRMGLGQRLMRYVLDQARDAVAYLTATDYGRPVYERLGFRAIDTSVTYTGGLAAGPRAAAALRRVTAADLPALQAADLQVFGADRADVLGELVTFADDFLMAGDAGAGYGAAWANEGIRMIGPVVAPDSRGAAMLIAGLAAGWTGAVRVDVLGRHAELAAWALASGLTARGETALMVRGGDLPGDRAAVLPGHGRHRLAAKECQSARLQLGTCSSQFSARGQGHPGRCDETRH